MSNLQFWPMNHYQAFTQDAQRDPQRLGERNVLG